MTVDQALIAATIGSAVTSVASSAHQASAARKQQAAALAHEQKQAALKQRIEERKLERQRQSEEASARARLGASGVGSSGGSGAAVLRGLNSSYDQALHDSRALFNSSMEAGPNLLDDGVGNALQMGQQVFGAGERIFGVLKS